MVLHHTWFYMLHGDACYLVLFIQSVEFMLFRLWNLCYSFCAIFLFHLWSLCYSIGCIIWVNLSVEFSCIIYISCYWMLQWHFCYMEMQVTWNYMLYVNTCYKDGNICYTKILMLLRIICYFMLHGNTCYLFLLRSLYYTIMIYKCYHCVKTMFTPVNTVSSLFQYLVKRVATVS